MDGEIPALRRHPTVAELARVQSLYDRALLKSAWQTCLEFTPPEDWPGHDAAVLAGRLLGNWGDSVAADRVHRLNQRRHPHSAVAVTYAGYTKRRLHGPFETLRWIESQLPRLTDPGSPRDQAHLLSQRATLRGEFRDFPSAHALLRQADELVADDPWIECERSEVLAAEDRYDEALAAARRSLELRPWYRPGLERLVHLLKLRNRDDEAVALMAEASTHIESGYLQISRASLLQNLHRWAEAEAVLAPLEGLLPRMPKVMHQWLAGVRADLAYLGGRRAEAATLAAGALGAYHRRMVERLAVPEAPGRRIELPVPFVRQHHMTCAPATLTAISEFLGRPIDHVALAAQITYDGTPDHVERHWAESNGWHVREFQVTWESACALIDRGLPFTLTTVATQSAHLQAVTGYDSVLGTLIVRDPSAPATREALADELLKEQASNGPRGMVLVPATESARLADLPLPDTEIYDHWYFLRRALQNHDRASAEQSRAALLATAPDHRLTLLANIELASYDGALATQLTANRALLARYPEDVNLQLAELALLRRLGRTAEVRELLARRAVHRAADVFLRVEHVLQLSADQPGSDRVLRHAWRLAHWRPIDGPVLRLLGNVLWDRRQSREATQVYRLAATATVTDEDHWRSYFIASRHTGETEVTVAALRLRHETWQRRSSAPSCTLFNALDQLERTTEGFAALDEAMQARPADADLHLFAARSHANHGNVARARELLDAFATRSRRMAWLRASAAVARVAVDHPGALKAWREILAIEPLDAEAQREVARLLSLCEGRDAAVAHLRRELGRHPHFVPLHVALIEWIRGQSPADRLAAVDALLTHDPQNAWARRERALVLIALERLAEAQAEAENAEALEPFSPSSIGVLGDVHAAAGRRDEARTAFESAVHRYCGDETWMQRLLDVSRTPETKRQAVDFIEAEIRRQSFSDEAYLPFQSVARAVLEAPELTRRLTELRDARPEQWQTWAALGIHLRQAGLVRESVACLSTATERFPVLPRLKVELALSWRDEGTIERAIEAFEQAKLLNPTWTTPYLQLALTYEAAHRLPDAERVLRQALVADPTEAYAHGQLADLLWKRGEQRAAVETMERALFLDPQINWAWSRLHDWHRDLGRADGALGTVQHILQSRPGDCDVWLRLARQQAEIDSLEDAIESTAQALRCDSRSIAAHDLRAELLVTAGRVDEARLACTPPQLASVDPFELRGRAAWIDHRSGARSRAIQTMLGIVAKQPDYHWGWERLCIWHSEAGDHASAHAAAERLVWLNPRGALPYARRAIAELELKRRPEAKASLRLALAREPDHLWSAHRLLELLIEDSELAEAGQVLTLVQTHGPGPAALRAELELHRAAGRREEMRRCLTALARLPKHHAGEFVNAVQSLHEHRCHDVVNATLTPLLRAPDALTEVGTAWVRSWGDSTGWRRIYEVDRPGVTTAIADDAWQALLEYLGEKKHLWTLRYIRVRHRAALQASNARWGGMNYALATSQAYREAIAWTDDYRTRTDVLPWMVFNRALSLLAEERWAEFNATAEFAASLTPDHVRRSLLAFLAFGSARAGNMERTRKLLREVGPEGLGAAAGCCRAAAEALVTLETEPGSAPLHLAGHFHEQEKYSGEFSRDPLTRIVHTEYTRIAAKRSGSGASWRKERSRVATARRVYAEQQEQQQPASASTAGSGSGSNNTWLIVVAVLIVIRLIASLGK